ncbi:MAG: glycoside hydrolase family 172 protein [Verrucomicrobiota bacterium]
MFDDITLIKDRVTGRVSSWDTRGRNADCWSIPAGESRVLADITGPGRLTHIWMTQARHYRHCLIRITWDNADHPSVLCPLGDFFGLGHGLVASYQSLLFSASTRFPYQFEKGCALNSYVPMPFRERALVELVNESDEEHWQYFYIDYETGEAPPSRAGFFHAEFRRANPFRGWGPEIASNREGSHLANIANKEQVAWDNNYVILETEGRGHYIGCNLSVTNFRGDWWGEGDDMIWIDGYKWPPDLHGTGSEDYLNQAWGMQDNAFLRNGSSIFEGHTLESFSITPWDTGGYQTSYVHHLENPVRFKKTIKVTIEHGHGNHLANEMASTAYWYAEDPGATAEPPPVAKRMPILRDAEGKWLIDPGTQCPGQAVPVNEEMQSMKEQWEAEFEDGRAGNPGDA